MKMKESIMQVKECMSTNVKVLNKDEKLQKAAQLMKENHIGCVPIESHDKLIGMITDRDIALVVADHASDLGTLSVGNCLTDQIKYCFEDEDLKDVEIQMESLNVRRLPVMNRDKRLVGIVSMKDFTKQSEARI